jgi:hypothetical protein
MDICKMRGGVRTTVCGMPDAYTGADDIAIQTPDAVIEQVERLITNGNSQIVHRKYRH